MRYLQTLTPLNRFVLKPSVQLRPHSHPHSRSRSCLTHGSLLLTAARPPTARSSAARHSLAVTAARPPARASSYSFPFRGESDIPLLPPCLILPFSNQSPHVLIHLLCVYFPSCQIKWRLVRMLLHPLIVVKVKNFLLPTILLLQIESWLLLV